MQRVEDGPAARPCEAVHPSRSIPWSGGEAGRDDESRVRACLGQISSLIARTEGKAIERSSMKIVIFGGSGLIGTRLVKNLRERGNDVIPASPRTGINAMTG